MDKKNRFGMKDLLSRPIHLKKAILLEHSSVPTSNVTESQEFPDPINSYVAGEEQTGQVPLKLTHD